MERRKNSSNEDSCVDQIIGETKNVEFKRQQSNYSNISDSSSSTSLSNDQSEPFWSWIVLVACFLCLCVLDGISYTFGMFLEPLMKELQCGRSSVSSAGSLQVGIYSMTGILASRLVTKYGSRPVSILGSCLSSLGLICSSYSWNLPSLLASYSVITGLGFGLMYIPAVVAVAEHFSKRRALAMGICVCGTGVGTFLLAPVEHVLLTSLGWRWAFICMAAACFLCILCGLAMTPVQQEPTELQQRRRRSTIVSFHGDVLADLSMSSESLSFKKSCTQTLGSLFLSKDLLESPALSTFLLVALADGVATLALFIPFTYLPSLATVSGVSSEKAAFLISAAGISSSVGRIISGWLCDKTWCDPIVLTLFAIFSAAIPPLILPSVGAYLFFLIFSCAFGLLTGLWISATSPLLVKVLGLNLLPPAFGLMTAVQGVAALTGPPLAGAIIDVLGNQGVAFHMTGGLLLSASLAFVGVAFQNRRRERRLQYHQL